MCKSMESVGGRMQNICFCQGQVADLKPAGKQKKLESRSLAVLCVLVGVGGIQCGLPKDDFKK